MSEDEVTGNGLPATPTPAAAHGGANVNFRWDDYPLQVVSSFKNLKEEEDFVDVTLACNSHQFTAHKVVLSACSPYFRQLLKVSDSIAYHFEVDYCMCM